MIILDRVKKINEGRPILKSLITRNLKDRYGGAVLGVLWSVINPCLIALVITFVFSFVMKSEIKNFPLFVLSGLLPWFFFSNSLTESAFSMRQNQDILNRFPMTKEIVPLSVVLSNLMHLVTGLVIMVPFFVLFNPLAGRCLLILPIALLLFCLFTIGVCMCFSILTIYYRDVSQLLGVGTMFLFWMTPVFYNLNSIPLRYHWIMYCNPLFSYIRIFQALLYEGSLGHIYWWGASLLFMVISLVGGYVFFTCKEDEALKYL